MAASAATGVELPSDGAGVEPPALVPTGDLPQVSPPAVPEVPSAPALPETPSATSTPEAPSVPSSSSSSSSEPAGDGAAPPAPARARAAQDAAAPQRRERLRKERGERQLRRSVERLSACLPGLPRTGRRVLELRAGLDGEALSRRETARRLELSPRRVRRTERSALRELRTCGGSTRSSAPAPDSAPPLQPLTLLASAPRLVSTEELAEASPPRERQGVLGESSASEERAESGGAPRAGIASAQALAAGDELGDDPSYPWVLLGLLLLSGIVALFVASRRGRAEPVPAGFQSPPSEDPRPAPVVEAPPQPKPPATQPPPVLEQHANLRRAGKPAALIASGIASLLVARLRRKRRR